MTLASRSRQGGMALLALLAVIALGASWFLVSKLNAESAVLTAVTRNRNAEVLNRAKLALIGYVAAQAAKPGENRPGALPCPEAAADFNDSANEGTISYPCTLPKVGRFPWRSLGLDKLVDASGEPLWYAVASGWAGANTVINSNCATYNIAGLACSTGRLTVDGVTDDVVALIIAPGPAFNVASAAGCGAKSQTRPVNPPGGTPDWSNYLECDNATYPTPDANFVTTGPSGSFNDQVVKVTTADLIPAIEAAIAQRIEREIAPALQTVYTPASWGFAGTKPVYPYAAPFADPSTSAMEGASGTLRGLLPMVYSETYPNSGTLCTAGASAPLCQPSFVAWTAPSLSGASMLMPNCTGSTATAIVCNFYRTCFLACFTTANYNFTITATATNLGMALRQKSITVARMTNVNASPAATVQLLSSGAASFSISGTTTATTGAGLSGVLGGLLCGVALPFLNVCKTETITIPINAVFVDHPLLDARTSGASTNWFMRNKWHELTYYAVAQGRAPAAIATTPGCIDSPPASVTCLSVANVSPASKQRAILILAGRSINGTTRPSSTLADYLEFGNGTGSFEKQAVSGFGRAPYPDTGATNAFLLATAAIATGTPFQFKAANANTGAATLNTPGTGPVAIVNADGSSLTAGQIQANSVVEAIYSGTQMILYKRPFNDRIVVVDSNP